MSWEVEDSLSETKESKIPIHGAKPHISPSAINLYTKCGEAYRRRYINREVIPPGISLLKGTSIHRGAEHNFKQKIKTREDLKKSDIIDFSIATFDEEMERGGIILSPEEESIGKDKVVGEAKDSTARLATVLADEVMPNYQPASVEEKVRIDIPNATHDLLSIADMVDEKDNIVELKTGKRWTQSMADVNTQITFQAATFKALHKKDPAGIVVENIVDNKTALRNPVVTQRGVDDFSAMINRINAVLDGINKGVFTPANDGAWWCHRSWCGYHSSCPFVRRK
jgi:hypothetical protein